jgi:glycosyltransferase involved in cell wall biosynthesis
VRALGRVGQNSYRVLLPTIADDVGGVQADVVTEYRASRTTAGRLAAMGHALAFGGRIRKHFGEFDVLHFPLTVMVPRVAGLPTATTVLDLQHEALPQFFSRAELNYRRVMYRQSIRRSALVITISQHAAQELVEHLGIPEDRIRPIHLGIDHESLRPGDEERGNFLLYPARPWPHKNHRKLFDAFQVLRERHPDLELVLTSYEGPVPDGVRSLGHVSRRELVRLYQTATALVFPSLYEGFGQPPLEAMACGCPVACSNAASLTEVCGDAARLFDPTSIEAIIEALEDVLADGDAWRRRGLGRAQAFTWDETARRHDEVYAELRT